MGGKPGSFFPSLARLCGRVILAVWAVLWALLLTGLTARNVQATGWTAQDLFALALILVPAALVVCAWRWEHWGAWLLLALAVAAWLVLGENPQLAGLQYGPAILGSVLLIGARFLERGR